MSTTDLTETTGTAAGGAGPTAEELATFLYAEAGLLDRHDYESWLALWDDKGVYWIPAGGEDTDPEHDVSFVYDNRPRLGMRVKQLQTGYRYAQLPQSRTQHYITNVEIADRRADCVVVRSSYLVIEARFDEVHLWPGRAEHELAPRPDGGFAIRRKTIVFINNDQPVTSMAFLP